MIPRRVLRRASVESDSPRSARSACDTALAVTPAQAGQILLAEPPDATQRPQRGGHAP